MEEKIRGIKETKCCTFWVNCDIVILLSKNTLRNDEMKSYYEYKRELTEEAALVEVKPILKYYALLIEMAL